jgi:preprotein translocase subunit SecD
MRVPAACVLLAVAMISTTTKHAIVAAIAKLASLMLIFASIDAVSICLDQCPEKHGNAEP